MTATAADRRDPSCRRPLRLHVSYTLTAAATITVTLADKQPGRIATTGASHRLPATVGARGATV